MRTYHGDTAPGPFSLNNLPVITGSGEVQMVVRDLLGREQVVVQPYYASNRLLKSGLTDQTYEFGFLRDRFGVASNDYGPWLGVATHRRGYSDRFTGELRAELQEDSQALGVAALYVPQNLGVLDASFAFSHGDRGGGGLLALGFERQDRFFSFGFHTQYASRGFAQLGLAADALPAVRRTTLRGNVASGRWGSLGAAYIRQDNRSSADTELLNATYSYNIAHGWYLSLNAFRNLTDERNYAINVTLTRAVDEHTTASLATTKQEGADTSRFQLQRSLPVGPGVGYRLLAEHGEFEHVLGGVSMQNDVGTYTLEADRFEGETSYRGLVSGSVAVMDGHVFLSRRLGDGFAVVEVPGYSNVRVYAENQLVAETDEDGLALVPGLRAYDRNRIGIEFQDLPLDARFDKLLMETSPYLGSGAYVRFPVTRASAATFRVLLPDGTPLPAGAAARVEGGSEDFPVGRDGGVYVAGLRGTRQVVFQWPGHECAVELTYPDSDEPLPDLGEYVCAEGAR